MIYPFSNLTLQTFLVLINLKIDLAKKKMPTKENLNVNNTGL